MMELFLRLERSAPPPPLQGGIKPGMDNLPFHVLSNSISIIPPPNPRPPNPPPPPQRPPGGRNQTRDG